MSKPIYPSYTDMKANKAGVIEWANSNPRMPPSTAFHSGPEREAAEWIIWAEERIKLMRKAVV